MLLNANAFDSVVNSLESGSPLGANGHRREPRVALSTRVTILPCPHGLEAGLGVPLSVPVRDLSRGGLRFLLPRRLPLDTQFVALLPGVAFGVQPVAQFGVRTADEAAGEEESTGSAPASQSPDAVAAGGETQMAVLCTVAYWQPLAKDLFALGAQFLRPVPEFVMPDVAPRIVLPGEVEGEAPVILRAPIAPPPPQRVAS